MESNLFKYGRYKESLLEKLEKKSEHKEDQETSNRINNYRTINERDHARVLYSSSFRRLQGKMQLFIPFSSRFNRNRLTHSLEVAQISRVIAKKLGLKNVLTVETCSLAHDIGHPPFGHSGEHTLNLLGKKIKFEGNAQTFRILRHLEEKHYAYNGLNLSYRTLLGTVKYFNNYKMNNDKYLYDEDYDFVREIKDEFNLGKEKTIDAEIMDIADEIAYAAHDLEDAFYFKWFTIDELLYEFQISKKYKSAYEIFKKIIAEAKKFAKQANTYKTSEEYIILFKKQLTSTIVSHLVTNIQIKDDKLCYGTNDELFAEGLKKLTYATVSRSPQIKLYEQKGENVIKKLYEVYMDRDFNKDMRLLPAEYRYQTKKDLEDLNNWEESVIDYISGMMDEYAIAKYKEFFGENSLNTLYLG